MPKVEVDTDKVEEFQEKLKKDKGFREKFAANPKVVFEEEGIEVPEEMIPEKVDLESLEQGASRVSRGGVVPIVVWW